MKKILIILSLIIFSFSAYAQQRSIITGSGSDTTSYSKTKKIKDYTTDDINTIVTLATCKKPKNSNGKDVPNATDCWNDKITNANKELEESKNKLSDIISQLESKNDVFLEKEQDLGIPVHAKYNVPVCKDENNRLVFRNENPRFGVKKIGWFCEKPISCNAVNGGQKNWIQKNGLCIKPKAFWKVGEWEACQDDPTKAEYNTQKREVRCIIKGETIKNDFESLDADQRTPVYDPCSKPMPLISRECAGFEKIEVSLKEESN